jgi:DNA mismatch endonuclease (patch repair protein)
MARFKKKRSAAARSGLSKSEQMRRVRTSGTTPELLVRKNLWRLGYRYRLHTRLPGTPDLCFAGARVVVFVDGCFWHGCQIHYTAPATRREFWLAKLVENVQRDRRVDEALARMGWTVVRIWEHEVKDDASAAVARIVSAVSDADKTPVTK